MNQKNNRSVALNDKYAELSDDKKLHFKRLFSDMLGIRGEKTIYIKLRKSYKMTTAEQMVFDKAYKEVTK